VLSLEQFSARTGSVTLVTGLPGMGKTMSALRALSQVPDHAVVWCGDEDEVSSLRALLTSSALPRAVLIDGLERASSAFVGELERAVVTHRETAWCVTSRRYVQLAGATLVTMTFLGDEEASELLNSMLVSRGIDKIEEPDLASLVRASGGNPENVSRIVDAIELYGARDVTRGVVSIPDATESLVAVLYEELDREELEVLEFATLFQGPFQAHDLRARGEHLIGALRELLHRGALVRVPTEPPGFSLHESLARQVRVRIELTSTEDAWTTSALAIRALRMGKLEEAQRYAELAGALARNDLERARVHDVSASIARSSSSPDEALVSYDVALELLEDGHTPTATHIRINRATALWEKGQHHEATREILGLLDECRQQGDRKREGIVLSNYGVMVQHEGRLDEAAELMADALRIHREVGHRRFEGIGLADLGMLDHERGVTARALERCEAAIQTLQEIEDLRHDGVLRAASAALRTRLGLALGDADFEEMRMHHRALQDADSIEAIDLYERLTTVYRSPLSEDLEVFEDEEYASRSDEVRLAARILADVTTAIMGGEALVVDRHSRKFKRSRQSEWSNLGTRQAYSQVFDAVLDARQLGAEPLTLEQVYSVGWPNEDISPESMRNRVHVALSALRRMGLRGVLVHRDGGYSLSMDVPVLCIEGDSGA